MAKRKTKKKKIPPFWIVIGLIAAMIVLSQCETGLGGRKGEADADTGASGASGGGGGGGGGGGAGAADNCQPVWEENVWWILGKTAGIPLDEIMVEHDGMFMPDPEINPFGHWECAGTCADANELCQFNPTDEIPVGGYNDIDNPPECVCLADAPGDCNWYDPQDGQGEEMELECDGSCDVGEDCISYVGDDGVNHCECAVDEGFSDSCAWQFAPILAQKTNQKTIFFDEPMLDPDFDFENWMCMGECPPDEECVVIGDEECGCEEAEQVTPEEECGFHLMLLANQKTLSMGEWDPVFLEDICYGACDVNTKDCYFFTKIYDMEFYDEIANDNFYDGFPVEDGDDEMLTIAFCECLLELPGDNDDPIPDLDIPGGWDPGSFPGFDDPFGLYGVVEKK
jgi:hypothetical protein